MTRCLLALASLAALAASLRAQNDTDPTEKPVAVWHFNAADEPGVPKAAAKFLEPGPRPASYPAFAKDNNAMAFGAAHSAVTVREADLPKANLRFGPNDSITIEAWVQ